MKVKRGPIALALGVLLFLAGCGGKEAELVLLNRLSVPEYDLMIPLHGQVLADSSGCVYLDTQDGPALIFWPVDTTIVDGAFHLPDDRVIQIGDEPDLGGSLVRATLGPKVVPEFCEYELVAQVS